MMLGGQTRGHPRISPDGARVALHALDQESDIWLWDLVRPTLTRLTVEPGADIYPVWAEDSRRLFWAGRSGLYTQAADRTGMPTTLLNEPGPPPQSTSVSPNGDRLVFHRVNPKNDFDVMQLQLDGAKQVTPLVQTRFSERNADVSPDGRWLAYEANDSGLFEIYVTPFPDSGGRSLVSTNGGRQPLWARGRTGRLELFYLEGADALMRVGVMPGTMWAATLPEKLFDIGRYYAGSTVTAYGRMYDVAADGRFLMIKPGVGSGSPALSPTSLVVVQHVDEELKRLVAGR
jgi:Tol biopolymer transport system component